MDPKSPIFLWWTNWKFVGIQNRVQLDIKSNPNPALGLLNYHNSTPFFWLKTLFSPKTQFLPNSCSGIIKIKFSKTFP